MMPAPSSSESPQAEFRYRGPGGLWLRDAALYAALFIAAMWWEDIYGSTPGAKMIMTFVILVAAAPVAIWFRWVDIAAGGDSLRIRKGRERPMIYSFASIDSIATTSDDDGEMPYPRWSLTYAAEIRLKGGRAVKITLPPRAQGEFLAYMQSRGFTVRSEGAR